MKNSILCFVPVGLRPGPVMTVNVVSFDHAIEGLAIDRENTRRGLFVSASVFQHTGNVASLDGRERDEIVINRKRSLR